MTTPKETKMTSGRQLAILFATTLLLATPALAPTRAEPLSADQRGEIETIIRNYLVQHPEVLQDAMAELEKLQQAAEAETNPIWSPAKARSRSRRAHSTWW